MSRRDEQSDMQNQRCSRKLAFLLFFFLCVVFSGCFSFQSSQNLQNFRLPLPTKDEVALVNGRALNLADFITIRSVLKKPTDENTFWAGIATLAIEEECRTKGKEISPQSALKVAQYAIEDLTEFDAASSIKEFYLNENLSRFPSPFEVKKEIDLLLSKALIQKGSQALSLIR